MLFAPDHPDSGVITYRAEFPLIAVFRFRDHFVVPSRKLVLDPAFIDLLQGD